MWLVVHHVEWWSMGGATDLANLVLLCAAHHRAVHDRGWRLEPAGLGRWTFHAPTTGGARSWNRGLAVVLPDATDDAAASLLAAGRAHAADLEPDERRRLLRPVHWDGDPRGYDHDAAVGLLAERLAA